MRLEIEYERSEKYKIYKEWKEEIEKLRAEVERLSRKLSDEELFKIHKKHITQCGEMYPEDFVAAIREIQGGGEGE